MGYSTFFFIICISFLTLSCGSSDKKTVKNKNHDSAESSDSTVHRPGIAPPPQTPGTMQVKAKVLRVKKSEHHKGAIYLLKVLRIKNIGSNTPLLNVQDSVRVFSVKSLHHFKVNRNVSCTIQHTEARVEGTRSTVEWQLLNYKD